MIGRAVYIDPFTLIFIDKCFIKIKINHSRFDIVRDDTLYRVWKLQMEHI